MGSCRRRRRAFDLLWIDTRQTDTFDTMIFDNDHRVRVVKHPTMGRTLVASETLRKGDTLWYWGAWRTDEHPDDAARNDYEVGTPNPCGVIDPTPFCDSVMQYANAPGPGELPNITATSEVHVCAHTERAGVRLRCICDIPVGHQVVWRYGTDWFESRGLRRLPVHLPQFPVRKRAKRKPTAPRR